MTTTTKKKYLETTSHTLRYSLSKNWETVVKLLKIRLYILFTPKLPKYKNTYRKTLPETCVMLLKGPFKSYLDKSRWVVGLKFATVHI